MCVGKETELSFCLILDLQPMPKVSYVSVIRKYFKTRRKGCSHTCLYWVCLSPAASPSHACLQHSRMNRASEAWVWCLGPFIRVWHQNGASVWRHRGTYLECENTEVFLRMTDWLLDPTRVAFIFLYLLYFLELLTSWRQCPCVL